MRHLVCAVLLFTAARVVADDDSWTGKVILPKRTDAKMHQFKTDGTVALSTVLNDNLHYRVLADKGAQVKVVNSQGVEGWLDKNEAVLREDAVEHFSKEIANNPRSPGNYQKRAYAYRQQGKFDSAIRDINDAIRLGYYDMGGWNSRGIIYTAQKDYDKAIRDFQNAISLNFAEPAAHCNLGNVRLAQKDFRKAIDNYSMAIRLDPRMAYCYSQRGAARFMNREYDEALEDFAKAEGLDPNDPTVYWNRARMLATCGAKKYRDGKQAIEQASKALKLDVDATPEKLEIVAAAHAETGDYGEAIRWQQRVIDALPASDQEDARRMLQLYEFKKVSQPKK